MKKRQPYIDPTYAPDPMTLYLPNGVDQTDTALVPLELGELFFLLGSIRQMGYQQNWPPMLQDIEHALEAAIEDVGPAPNK